MGMREATTLESSRPAGPYRRFGAVGLILCASLLGCRTTEADIHRWGSTAQGPDRLVAVVRHDKYGTPLRLAAARMLISMRPRSGQRVGIPLLVESLEQLPEDTARELIDGLVPILLAELAKPATISEGQRIDESIPFKDVAYALLASETLVRTAETRKTLEDALVAWVSADFDARVDDPTQSFGVEQVVRHLGARGVEGLPRLITTDSEKLDRALGLIAELGDEATKRAASERLVGRARFIASNEWRSAQTPLVEAQNQKAKLAPTEDQFRKQLDAYQEEQVLKAFSTMKRIGQGPIVDYLLSEAENTAGDDKRRATALAALEGNLRPEDAKSIRRVLDLAGAPDTPDAVRDLALRRASELPRSSVVEDLYALFSVDRWKLRWVAAEAILGMSDQTHLSEFMSRLGKVKHLSLTEPLRYGTLLADLKGPRSALDLASHYADPKHPSTVRVTALGYFYEHGTLEHLEYVEPYSGDPQKVPGCAPNADECEWICSVSGQARNVETIGHFVDSCLKPAMQARKHTKAETKQSKKAD
jgi:hypothetical protein